MAHEAPWPLRHQSLSMSLTKLTPSINLANEHACLCKLQMLCVVKFSSGRQ